MCYSVEPTLSDPPCTPLPRFELLDGFLADGASVPAQHAHILQRGLARRVAFRQPFQDDATLRESQGVAVGGDRR